MFALTGLLGALYETLSDGSFSAICAEVGNAKFEARNPKQIPMTKIRMTETVTHLSVLNIGEHWSICALNLSRVSDFGIRI
jgi:hypothetical protein